MEAVVLHFDDAKKKGILRTDTGQRYEFTADEWKSEIKPKSGLLVDFVAENNIATGIFVLKSTGMPSELLSKVSDLQGSISDLQRSDVGKRVSSLFSNGLHNKFGVIASISVLVSLFFPVIEIPFLGTGSLIHDGTGKFLFFILSVLAIFFYGGATKLYIRILTGLVLSILFFQYYDLFSGLSQANDMFGMFGSRGRNSPNFFNLVQWGAFVNIATCVALFIAAFVKRYTPNSATI